MRWLNPCTGRSPKICKGRSNRANSAHGEKLPSEMEFREGYNNASRNTIRDAIKRLTSLGLVETKPGQGTFVTMRIVPFVTELSGDPQAPGRGRGHHVPRRGQQD